MLAVTHLRFCGGGVADGGGGGGGGGGGREACTVEFLLACHDDISVQLNDLTVHILQTSLNLSHQSRTNNTVLHGP